MSLNFGASSPPMSAESPSSSSSSSSSSSEPINIISGSSGASSLSPTLQEMLYNIGARANMFPTASLLPQPSPPQISLPPLAQLSFNPFLQTNQMLNSEFIRQFLTLMNGNNPLITSRFGPMVGSNSGSDERQHKMKREKSCSVENNDDMSFDNNGDIIVPSNDKEGWCRNKKYIEKTEAGFMCTVCRKVYGRYNSVSYHVTIYHRNPPIKCNLNNCQFTTREARYIHFHKYYRHGIPLPQNIDQGSRKCPHCRHVSKSPAMLEKHIRRHQIKEDQSEGSDVLDSILPRNRTVTICVESMEVENELEEEEDDEEIETKPRSCTM